MRRIVLLLTTLALLVPSGVFAQGITGTVQMVVSDSSGNALPGCTVTASSPEVLGSRTAITDSSGTATLAGLDPSSSYTVLVSLSGFSTTRFEKVLIKAGQKTALNAAMAMAAVEEEIIVTAESPVVDFSSTISGQDITLELTEALPTSRTYQSYLQLVPGVMPTDPSIAEENPAVRSGLNYRDIYGDMGVSRDNNYYIEGINVTDGVQGTFGANLNTEIIQEQSVMTGGIPAEFAGAPGLVSNVITKNGGNEFSGSLNYYTQSDSLVADNDHAEDASFSTYDTAFTLGGPILHDKAWFFASYRLLEREQDVNSLDTNEYLRTPKENSDQAFLKLSYNPTTSIKLTGTYLSDPMDRNGSFDRSLLNNRDITEDRGGNRWVAAYSHVFGPAYLTFSIGEHNGEVSQGAASQDIFNNVIFSGDDAVPHTLADEQLGGDGDDNLNERDNEFWRLSGSYFLGSSWGDHTLSAGYEAIEHINYRDSNYIGGAKYWSLSDRYLGAGVTADDLDTGTWTEQTWTVSNVSDFEGMISGINGSANRDSHYAMLDLNGDGFITMEEAAAGMTFGSTSGNPNDMVNYTRTVQSASGPQNTTSKGQTFYLQDSFQTNRLTINVGFRMEEYSHHATTGENIFTFDWEVAPRIGAIYDLTGEAKHKLSAFYGRYYDPIRNNMTNFAGTLTGRVLDEQVWVNDEWITYRTRGGPVVQDAFFAPSTKTPYTDDIQISYQMQLSSTMSLEASYINRKTRDILEDYDLCLYALCTDGTNYYPGDTDADGSLWLGLDYFGYAENPGSNFVIATLEGGKRDWEGIELVFRKRFSDHWQALGSYTYADAEGNSNSDSNADFQGDVLFLDPRAPNQLGTQPGMIEHLFKMAGSYQWDNGITLGGAYRWNSGTVASRTFSAYRRHLPVQVDDAYEWNGATEQWLQEDAVGSIKNDSFGTLDLRVQYNHRFAWLEAEVFLDVFNFLDDQAATRNQDLIAGQGGTSFGDPVQWVPPRRFYLGTRLAF